MKVERIKTSMIENNSGQVDGLPSNPRKVNKAKLRKLAESISDDPELLEMRPLIVYPLKGQRGGGKFVVVGGNMRLRALRQLQMSEAPCIVLPSETSVEKLRAITVKDNGSFGEWDMEALKCEFDIKILDTVFAEMPKLEMPVADNGEDGEVFEERPQSSADRKGWHKKSGDNEPRCNLGPAFAWHTKRDKGYLSCFRTTAEGFPLSDLKTENHVNDFANAAAEIVRRAIGRDLEGWEIVTTPKRRHTDWNFSEAVCERLAETFKIGFTKEAIAAKNRQRIKPEFSLVKQIESRNVLLFDDIVTTGSTICACHALLTDKNVFTVIGIYNGQ